MVPCRHPKQQSLSREAGDTFLEPEASLLFSQASASTTCFSPIDTVDMVRHFSSKIHISTYDCSTEVSWYYFSFPSRTQDICSSSSQNIL